MTPPSPTPRGQVTFLPTADLEATHAFYGDLIGLPLVRDQGLCRIYRTGVDAFVGFCARGYAIPREFRVVVTLLVDDVAEAFERLIDRGVVAETTPKHSPTFQVTSFFVRDPNGYLLELQRFDEPLA
jgi:catechol 2,3-dioxygenase-like lactoylglutathione lyase family enzyme